MAIATATMNNTSLQDANNFTTQLNPLPSWGHNKGKIWPLMYWRKLNLYHI